MPIILERKTAPLIIDRHISLEILRPFFLGLGLLLARSPLHYVRLVGDASRAVGPIILQYPFYAGIMALMTQTDLVNIISGWFVAIASTETLGFWAFIAGGVLNFFIPSGSGQAFVTMPIMSPLATLTDVPQQTAVLAFQFGDGLSNTIVPTSGILMGMLALARIPYGRWLRFVLPLFVQLLVLAGAFLAIAVAIDYS